MHEDSDPRPPGENPYREMARPDAVEAPAVVSRPSGVTVTAAMCFIGGILGLLVGMALLGNAVFGNPMAMKFQTPNNPIQEAMDDMTRGTEAVAAKFRTANIASGVSAMLIGIGLVVGGVGLLMNKEWARKLLLRTLIAAMVVECLRVALNILMQFEMVPVMRTYMEKVTANPTGGGGPPPAMMANFATVMMYVGLAFAVAWLLAKLGLFYWGHLYLRKPHVVEYFRSASLEKK